MTSFVRTKDARAVCLCICVSGLFFERLIDRQSARTVTMSAIAVQLLRQYTSYVDYPKQSYAMIEKMEKQIAKTPIWFSKYKEHLTLTEKRRKLCSIDTSDSVMPHY